MDPAVVGTCVVCHRPAPAADLVIVRVETRGRVRRAWVEWRAHPGPCEQVARSRAAHWTGPIEKAIVGLP